MRDYYVYIMTNRSGTLYTGVTNNLERRVHEHTEKLLNGFTEKYGITRLVYYELTSDVREAIAREKQIKSWRRSKKMALIRGVNPRWRDLAERWDCESGGLASGPDPSSFREGLGVTRPAYRHSEPFPPQADRLREGTLRAASPPPWPYRKNGSALIRYAEGEGLGYDAHIGHSERQRRIWPAEACRDPGHASLRRGHFSARRLSSRRVRDG